MTTPPPAEGPAAAPESEAVTLVKELAAAKKRRSLNAGQIGIGAAVGIGSAAIVAGLLYWRGGKK